MNVNFLTKEYFLPVNMNCAMFPHENYSETSLIDREHRSTFLNPFITSLHCIIILVVIVVVQITLKIITI